MANAGAAKAASPMQFGNQTGPINGDDLLEDVQKQLAVYTQVTTVYSGAYESSHVLKANQGCLLYLSGYNSGSAAFIQVFDAATVPADGAAPLKTFAIAGTSNFEVSIPVVGLPCVNGIVVCVSSTAPTKTLGSASVYFTTIIR
jgi:hypothetical protein